MTYSLAITGAPAGNPTQPQNLDIEDAVAVLGSAQNSMMTGEPFLCRGPDGSEAYYVYDAERTDFARGLRYLKKV